MIVCQQHPDRAGGVTCHRGGSVHRRQAEGDGAAAVLHAAHRQAAADRQRPLAHPADAAAANRRLEATAVVHDLQDEPGRFRRQGDVDAGATGVAHGVGDRLLGDPVDRQLGVVVDLRQRPGDAVELDVEPRTARDVGAQRGDRAGQSEVVERHRAQLVADPPQILEALARQLLRVGQRLGLLRRDPGLHPLQLEHDSGQILPDLVMQLLRDPPALRLLCKQHAAGARPPLRLEPVERRVERLDHGGDLGGAAAFEPLAGIEHIDRPHLIGEAAKRRQAEAEQRGVGDQHHGQPGRQHQQLVGRRRTTHRDRGQHEQGEGDQQDHAVHREDPPEQAELMRWGSHRAASQSTGGGAQVGLKHPRSGAVCRVMLPGGRRHAYSGKRSATDARTCRRGGRGDRARDGGNPRDRTARDTVVAPGCGHVGVVTQLCDTGLPGRPGVGILGSSSRQEG